MEINGMAESLMKLLKSSGMQVAQINARDAAKKVIVTVLVIDEPEDVQLADLVALQRKWETKA